MQIHNNADSYTLKVLEDKTTGVVASTSQKRKKDNTYIFVSDFMPLSRFDTKSEGWWCKV